MISNFLDKINDLKRALDKVYLKRVDVVDSLDDDDSGKVLSAKQGKVLFDGKSDVNHNHSKGDISDFPIIPSKVSDLVNDSGFLTSHQDISGKANISDLAEVATTGDYTDLMNIPSSFNPSSHNHGNISNDGKIGDAANKPLITGSNGVVTTGSFGDTTNSFAEGNHKHTTRDVTDFPTIPSKTSELTNDSGFLTSHQSLSDYVKNNDSRLSDARTPTSHTHGNISNDGKIGTASGKPLITTTGGKITTGSFGYSPGQFAEGGHIHSIYELSDFPSTMPPSNHSHGLLSYDGKLGVDSGKPVITGTGGEVTVGSFGTNSGQFSEGNHTHGALSKTGTLNSDISSVNKIAVTDNSNNLKTISQLPYSKISGTPTIPSKTSQLTNDSGYLTSHQNINGKEDSSNKVTSISSSSTNTQYPSAKLLYDLFYKSTSYKPSLDTRYVTNANNNMRLFKIGALVMAYCRFTTGNGVSTSNQWFTLTSSPLPSKYRPLQQFVGDIFEAGGSYENKASISFERDGTIQLKTKNAGIAYYSILWYLTSDVSDTAENY